MRPYVSALRKGFPANVAVVRPFSGMTPFVGLSKLNQLDPLDREKHVYGL